jgi:hypothetical protein
MYCKSLDGRSISCEPDVGSTWYPDLSPEIRFVGKNGKNYVLFKTERLSHGHYSDGYYVFFLVPKKINSKGYVIYSFQNSGAFDNSDREGKCVDEKDVEVGVHLNPPFEIINEGRSNVTVRFDREITNCKTGERFKTENAYVWQEFGFKESITRSTKIN